MKLLNLEHIVTTVKNVENHSSVNLEDTVNPIGKLAQNVTKVIEHSIAIALVLWVYILGAKTGNGLWLWLNSWYEQIVYHRYF